MGLHVEIKKISTNFGGDFEVVLQDTAMPKGPNTVFRTSAGGLEILAAAVHAALNGNASIKLDEIIKRGKV